jgi:hypothetical protein
MKCIISVLLFLISVGISAQPTPTQVMIDSGIARYKRLAGLDQINNTSDANKPVSAATLTALNSKLSQQALNDSTASIRSTAVTKTGSEYITGKTLGAHNFGIDAGSNDSYSITLSPAPSGYTQGMFVIFKANTANTGAASINVNGLGAKTIVKRVSTTLANGDIPSQAFCLLIYDGTNFILLNPVVN